MTSHRSLRRLTLLYLGLPVAIFFLGWLRGPLAFVMIGLLGWACWQAGWSRGQAQPISGSGRRMGWRGWVLGGLLPALAFIALSGAGGWGSGDSDWFKHDTILRDLIERPWPVAYQTSAGPVLLVYYVAFYLPAALVGKWTGCWMLASHTLALTMLLGMLLSLGWLAILGAERSTTDAAANRASPRLGWWWRGVAMFFCFSGLDVIGKVGVNLVLRLPAFHGDWSDVEWWAQAFQYPSNAAALFWAPHQAVGAWLPCALLLDRVRLPDRPAADAATEAADASPRQPDLLPLALAWFWSPFAALGLAPIFAGLFLARLRRPRVATLAGTLLQTARSPVNLAALAMAAVVTAFYAARLAPFAVPAFAVVTPGRSPAPLLAEGVVSVPTLYLAFVLLEFGLLGGVLWWSMRTQPSDQWLRLDRTLLWVAFTTLLLLPMVHYGYANDLVMRGGLPALFLLQILVLRAFSRGGSAGTPAALIAMTILLALGTANSFLEYRRHVGRMWRDHSWRDAARDDFATQRDHRPLPVQTLFELQHGLYNRPGFDFARQYLGSTGSFYGRHLAPRGQTPPAPMSD